MHTAHRTHLPFCSIAVQATCREHLKMSMSPCTRCSMTLGVTLAKLGYWLQHCVCVLCEIECVFACIGCGALFVVSVGSACEMRCSKATRPTMAKL